MLKFTLAQIAQVVGGTVEGDAAAEIFTVCKIEEGCQGGLCFLSNPKYTPYIYETKATAVLVNADFVPEKPVGAALIRVENAYMAFTKLLAFYNEHTQPAEGVSSLAFVDPTAKIGQHVYIGEFAVVGAGCEIGEGVKIYPQCCIGAHNHIGDGTVLYAGVKVYGGNRIGKNCVLHAGAVIGADGFGFAPNNGQYDKIPQIGHVVLEDNVEIGANTCVDKATMGATIIREGAKLDNLIQIGHNVVVGSNTVMAAQVGVAGSTKVGQNCMFGGQVGVAGHAQVADGVMLGAQSGVPGSIRKAGSVLLGTPPLEVETFRRSAVHFKNLDKIVKRLEALEEKLGSDR